MRAEIQQKIPTSGPLPFHILLAHYEVIKLINIIIINPFIHFSLDCSERYYISTKVSSRYHSGWSLLVLGFIGNVLLWMKDIVLKIHYPNFTKP